MRGPGLQMDERNIGMTRRICARLYLLTITALWLDVFYRQFVLEQDFAQLADIALILTANVLLFIGAVLYYGGVTIPRIRASVVAVFYLFCVAAGTGYAVFREGLTSFSAILAKMAAVAAIGAIIVVLYIVAALLGARRTEREIEE